MTTHRELACDRCKRKLLGLWGETPGVIDALPWQISYILESRDNYETNQYRLPGEVRDVKVFGHIYADLCADCLKDLRAWIGTKPNIAGTKVQHDSGESCAG